MLIKFSVILAFSTLFTSSIFDIKSEKGDVPEILLYTGIIGGIALHIVYSLETASIGPIYWSIGAGGLMSIYGYFAYRRGMWGGADMLALSTLGFSTSYFFGLIGTLDLLVNAMGTGFFYALGFGLFGGLRSKEVTSDFINRLKQEKLSFTGLLILGAILSSIAYIQGISGGNFFILYALMLLIYFFMQSVEENLMVKEVKASQVEKGDVLAEGEIKGVTEEELEKLEGDIKLKKGIRFMPVFPVALVLTALNLSLLEYMIHLF